MHTRTPSTIIARSDIPNTGSRRSATSVKSGTVGQPVAGSTAVQAKPPSVQGNMSQSPPPSDRDDDIDMPMLSPPHTDEIDPDVISLRTPSLDCDL